MCDHVQSTSDGTKRVYTMQQALAWAVQVARALRKLHTHSPCIMHRGGRAAGQPARVVNGF